MTLESNGMPDLVGARLLVADEAVVRDRIASALRRHGAAVTEAADGPQAQRLLESEHFDLILVDVRIPGGSGWDLLAAMRRKGDDTPVIFITASDGVEERVRGLRLGADDYLAKPFAMRELVARVAAVLRRRASMPVLHFGELRIDLGRRTIKIGANRIDLSPREFDLLRSLAEARGRVVSRAELLRDVWGTEFDPGTSMVEVVVARLRRKLDRSGRRMIQTLVGEGYRLARADEAVA